MFEETVVFDPELIQRYDQSGPRYTSYPTAVQFHEGFDQHQYQNHARFSNEELIPRPLSVYLHLPFCHALCYYCGCNKKVTRHSSHGQAYLKRLAKEITMQARLFDRDREVEQLHLGGGTPTFHSNDELRWLMAELNQQFSMSKNSSREFSIEIDPRTVDPERLDFLHQQGFNRISLGVQDFDAEVQKAVNRIQPEEDTLRLIEAANKQGFDSISLDLIYGLPLQTLDSFSRTLDSVIAARPNRLAVYNYAHMPQLFRAQRLIKEQQLPSPKDKLRLMELTIQRLTESGYVYIGMDHFALPDDELALAQRNGSLQRNFQGYSTHRQCDLIGMGVSAIGKVGDCYVQNLKHLPAYQAALDDDQLPVWRGLSMTTEDRIRKQIIDDIMCYGEVSYKDYEARFTLDFEDHFAAELITLEQQAADQLVELNEQGFQVTGKGHLLIRSIAMVFDEYLNHSAEKRFSKVI